MNLSALSPYLTYIKLAAAAAIAAAIFAAGLHVGALKPQRDLADLKAQGWQGKAADAAAALTATQKQLADLQAANTNNANVIKGLTDEKAHIAADRDANLALAGRLRNLLAAHPPAASNPVPAAHDQPGAAAATVDAGAGSVEGLLVDAADESALCAASYNALLAQLKPQLNR